MLAISEAVGRILVYLPLAGPSPIKTHLISSPPLGRCDQQVPRGPGSFASSCVCLWVKPPLPA